MEPGSDPLGLVGTTIAEKYAVESVVGEGGFAIVYRAMHALWKRPVAVKVFKALGEVAPQERQKLLDDFIQEGRLLADLSERSTAICQARDVGMLTTPRGDHVPYMVLEWLEGQPLDAVLEAERSVRAPLRSLDDAIHLLDPVAEALALAHKNGIAHRDVKPANVFVLGDPRGSDFGVKLLDFGIAKVVQDAQKMGFGKTAGHITSFTPSYGAPEQFNRAYGATGPWTDVFALALVTVEVLVGREPYSGDTIVQLAYASSDPGTRPVPRTYGLHTSDEVDAVFRKAVAVQPAERYQTAGEFWTALRTAALGRPTSSPFLNLRTDGLGGAAIVAPGQVNTPQFGVTVVAPNTIAAPIAGTPRMSAPASTQSSSQSPPVVPPTTAGKKSPAPILVALVGVVALGGAVVFTLNRRSDKVAAATAGLASASAKASTPASASASAGALDAATCPPGMKAIRGGEYFMGSDDKDTEANEKPPHNVKLAPYCLDEFEVTVARYKACSDRGACLRAGRENVWADISKLQTKLYDPLCNINDAVAKGSHPINCVDWEQSRKYCEATGGRLPTEAEWEFAARGSDGRRYPWGDQAPNAQLLNACGSECVAWMKTHPDPDQPILGMHEEDDGFVHTAPVGSFPKGKSSWGIQDIVGNVWEWVADWYAPYDPASADATTANPTGPSSGKQKVIRGGSWNGGMASWVRPSWRYNAVPTMRTHGIGFRCAKTL